MLGAARIAFLTPEAALIGLAALVPLAAVAAAEVRQRRVRRVLGLRSPGLRARTGVALGIALAFALLAAAAAQPVVRSSREVRQRADAEVYVAFDNSRSMLARIAQGAPTRFERAQRLAVELRTALPRVPVGVVSLTDRPVVHVFPTGNAAVFEETVDQALGIEKPPPAIGGQVTATDFGTLGLLGTDNFFRPSSTRRLVILLSDGESVPFDASEPAEGLATGSVGILAVRFWNPAERIWDPGGRLEPYLPDRAATAALDRVPALVGERAFAEDDVAGILGQARAYLEDGPAVVAGRELTGSKPLGAFVALAAAVPLALVVTRRR